MFALSRKHCIFCGLSCLKDIIKSKRYNRVLHTLGHIFMPDDSTDARRVDEPMHIVT